MGRGRMKSGRERDATHLTEILVGRPELGHQPLKRPLHGAQQGFVGAVAERQVRQRHAGVATHRHVVLLRRVAVRLVVNLHQFRYRLETTYTKYRKERNVLFNDALNTFYLRLYGVRHMVKDHSDSEKVNLLPPHRLLFPISSKGSFICTYTYFVTPVVEHWLEREIAPWVHSMKD